MDRIVVFDWDGTLHDTKKLYAESVRRAYSFLAKEGIVNEPCPYTDDYFAKYLGMTAREMWEDFMPGLDEELRARAEKIVGDSMVSLVRDGAAVLYDGVEAMFNKLTNHGYKLMILSNCKIAYLDAHREMFELDKWFTAYYPAQKYDFIPKEEILAQIMEQYPGEYVMVGDRFHDIRAGKCCGVKTIGCDYGFGEEQELASSDWIVGSIDELVETLLEMR